MARWFMAKQLLREQLQEREPDGHGWHVNALVEVVDEMIRCVAGLEWPYACGGVKTFRMYEDDGTPTRDTLEPIGHAAFLQQEARASRRRIAFSPDVIVRTYVPEPRLPLMQQREALRKPLTCRTTWMRHMEQILMLMMTVARSVCSLMG